MTWGKAMRVLAVCVLFDVLRGFFALFWLFGPAAAGWATSAVIGGTLGKVAGSAVGLLGAGARFVPIVGPAILLFGVVMAMMVALMGWLVVGAWLVISNRRMFKENAGNVLWYAGSLAVGQVPIINAVPVMTAVIWRLYRTQIKKERTQLAEYNRRKAELEFQKHQELLAQIAQYRAAQAAQAEAEQEDIAQGEAATETTEESAPDEMPPPMPLAQKYPGITSPPMSTQTPSMPPPLPMGNMPSSPPPLPTPAPVASPSVPPPLPGQTRPTDTPNSSTASDWHTRLHQNDSSSAATSFANTV